MRKFFTLSLLLFSLLSYAQEETEEPPKHWDLSGNTSVTFNQVALKNWSSGGKNSIAGTALFKYQANYKDDNQTWDNLIDLGYGMTKYSKETLEKSEDKILLQTTYGYNACANKLFYSASYDLQTQFANGWKDDTTKISTFFAPAYSTISIGLLYKPADWVSFYLSPVTGKMTFVCDTVLSESYGVDAGKKFRMEYGAYFKIEVDKKDIVKNVDYYLRATFFSNLPESAKYIDCDVETGFDLNINSWLTALIKVNMLFDNDIKYIDSEGEEHGARVQWKELFGFGFAFKW